ncbi:hypothetical protein [Pseudomonas sp. S2_A05]
MTEEKLHRFPIRLAIDLWLAAQQLRQKAQSVLVKPLEHVAIDGRAMKSDFTVFADRCFQQTFEYRLLSLRQTPDNQILEVPGGIQCFDQLRFVFEFAKHIPGVRRIEDPGACLPCARTEDIQTECVDAISAWGLDQR